MSRSLATHLFLTPCRVPVGFGSGSRVSGCGGRFRNRVGALRRELSKIHQPRHLQRDVVCCEQLLMSYDSETVSLRAAATTLRSTSAAVDPDWLLRWANRRRQSAVDVPCARCRHRPLGPGRRQGPAAGRGYSTEVWVGSVLREGPCGELAPIAPAYHRPPSGGGAGTPFCPIRGAVRPPQPPHAMCGA